MKSTKKSIKKSFEENLEDMCNFNCSEKSDAEAEKNIFKRMFSSTNKKSQGKRKNSYSNSRVETKESLSLSYSVQGNNSHIQKDSSLLEIVSSLKDKLQIYEEEIRSLLDEKVQMQVTINNLQIQSYNSNKKSLSVSQNKLSNSLTKSNESALELNKHYMQEASGLKKELKTLDNHIQKQKNLLEQNYSILEETVENNDELQTNNNLVEKLNSSNNINTSNNNKNMTTIYEGNKAAEVNEINFLNSQKDLINAEINKMKQELMALMEMQNGLVSGMQAEDVPGNNLSEVEQGNHSQQEENLCLNNNENTNVQNSSHFSNQNQFLGTQQTGLPNIETFFVLNSKVLLVDSEKNLWHLEKCKKFEKYSAERESMSKEEIFAGFIEYYQNLPKHNNKEEIEKGEDLIENISKELVNKDAVSNNSHLNNEEYRKRMQTYLEEGENGEEELEDEISEDLEEKKGKDTSLDLSVSN
jgi:hypothetical protein